MSSQSFFHSIEITLSKPEQRIFLDTRLRLSRSFSEPVDRIMAKVLAYCHSYSPDLVFSNGKDPFEPVIFEKSLIGDYVTWTDIAVPSEKKLGKVIRAHTNPKISLYFFREGQRAEFQREFKNLKSEYLTRLSIYEIDPKIVEHLSSNDPRHYVWQITFLENQFYLDADKIDYESTLLKLDPYELINS